MGHVSIGNLKAIRELLGKSQSEMALTLGTSTRAIQSYEQGWRKVPAHVLRCVMMLLFLNWRKNQTWIAPCWDIKKCSAEKKESCSAWRLRAGDLCWLVQGTPCCRATARNGAARVARCAKCEVTARWLSTQ
jgi:DNA-binding XRE family transcriptional regulator